MAKFYMMQFVDTKTNQQFYKFGHTSHNDALKRFSDESYKDFKIKCLASIKGTLPEVKLIENVFLCMYPKNIWLEDYLGDDRNWDGFSGITEIVSLDPLQYKHALKTIYRLKEKLEGGHE